MNFADANAYAADGRYEEGLEWVGRQAVTQAPYEVNQAQIGYFCALLEDPNENYWDSEAATRRFGSPISPPAMALVWAFPLPWTPSGRPDHGPILSLEVPLPGQTLINVATDTTFHQPMRVGRRLTFSETVTALSEPKETQLGIGHFVTSETEVGDDRGDHLATATNVVYRYDSHGSPEASPPPTDPSVQLDSDIPVLSMPITLTRCVLDAAATRDFFPGRHDAAYSRTQGANDAYLNTMFHQGFVDRVVTDWAGPDSWIARRRLRMLAPACVGETLKASGRITKHANHAGESAEIDITVSTESAIVVTAQIEIIPDRGVD